MPSSITTQQVSLLPAASASQRQLVALSLLMCPDDRRRRDVR